MKTKLTDLQLSGTSRLFAKAIAKSQDYGLPRFFRYLSEITGRTVRHLKTDQLKRRRYQPVLSIRLGGLPRPTRKNGYTLPPLPRLEKGMSKLFRPFINRF